MRPEKKLEPDAAARHGVEVALLRPTTATFAAGTFTSESHR